MWRTPSIWTQPVDVYWDGWARVYGDTAVIVGDTTGATDLVRDGENASVVPARNVDAIANRHAVIHLHVLVHAWWSASSGHGLVIRSTSTAIFETAAAVAVLPILQRGLGGEQTDTLSGIPATVVEAMGLNQGPLWLRLLVLLGVGIVAILLKWSMENNGLPPLSVRAPASGTVGDRLGQQALEYVCHAQVPCKHPLQDARPHGRRATQQLRRV